MKFVRIVLLFFLASLPVQAETIILAAEDDWYPFSANVNNEAKGLAVDIVLAAYKAVDIDVKFEVVPYARCMAMVESGQAVGCFNTTQNSALARAVMWPQTPLYLAKCLIYAGQNSRDANLGSHDLEGKLVGVTLGYEYGDDFDKNEKIAKDVAPSDISGFRKLALNRNDYIVAYEKVANYLFTKYPSELQGKFKPVGLLATNPLYVSYKRGDPLGARMKDKFDEGMRIIKKNGTYKAILKAWQ